MAGFFFGVGTMPIRVAVFIDYQNSYRGARRAFFQESDPSYEGQVHPLRLAIKLRGIDDKSRDLVAVRVYRGMPTAKQDAVGAAAADRQVALWEQQSLVKPITRSLNYRDPERPKEKGIDVSLAVDFVTMAGKEYDVGILFSEDTDLIPALEAVAKLKGPAACESATWYPLEGRHSPKPLLLPKDKLGAVHLLRKHDFDQVRNVTDYHARRRRR